MGHECKIELAKEIEKKMKRQCGHFLLYELFLVILYFNFSNSETFQLKANFESNLIEPNSIKSIRFCHIFEILNYFWIFFSSF